MPEPHLSEDVPLKENESIHLETSQSKDCQEIVPVNEESANRGSHQITSVPSEMTSGDALIANINDVSGRLDSESLPHDISELQRLALFGRRMLALIIDQVVCLGAAGFLAGPCAVVAFYCILEAPHCPGYLYLGMPAFAIVSGIFGWLFGTFFYCAKFESSAWQATPGKRLLGLKVVDNHGARIGYLSVLFRLLIQLAIVWFLCPFIVAQLKTALLGINWGEQDFLQFGPRDAINMLSPVFLVAACYFVSLFTRRGQTLFDIAMHRVVVEEHWAGLRFGSWNTLVDNLRQAFDILIGNRKRTRDLDFPLMFFSGCAGVCAVISVCLVFVLFYSSREAEQAVTESKTTFDLGSNPHYANARTWFRNVNNLPLYVAPFPTEDTTRKSTILSISDWSVRTAYALSLENQGNYQGAFDELKEALQDRHMANRNNMKGTARFNSYEKCLLPFSSSKELSIQDIYLKLSSLSSRLGHEKDAAKYLEQARKCERTGAWPGSFWD